MAIAAMHLEREGRKESSPQSTRLYSLAMAELRNSIDDGSVDYLGLLTTVLTFLFIEMFRGTSNTWRYHLSAGWKYLQHHCASGTWTSSEDAWYVTQSFYLLRIESETSLEWQDGVDLLEDQISSSEDAVSLERLSRYTSFGSTIGASGSILTRLSEINRLSRQLTQTGFGDGADPSFLDLEEVPIPGRNMNVLMLELGSVTSDDDQECISVEKEAQQLHLRAFEVATVIYHHQIFGTSTPEQLAPYVHAVLYYITRFLEICGGNYTLWPVVIAGVEAYTDDEMILFSTLFENAKSVGMRNRVKAKQLMEGVWAIRSSIATETGQTPGNIRVNWRQVMRQLDIDVLLV
ncbi:hypothetical protein LTR84_009401 [Exophiala bonariae]|uniref:Uncharacterized protein n=1 Tax=Exophiala bonariae TaxID=1690606 RepID=A0AAV9MXR0_9EURO|nr:hypothetical protein LTR84_009401 [Exophiala bonariae]